MKNIAIFASGRGSNFSAIVSAVKKGKLKVRVGLLVCDKKLAPVLSKAKKAKVKSLLIDRKDFKSKSDFEKEIIKHLSKNKIDLIVLAGFMRILGKDLIRAYKNRIINIHPTLLPSFKGAHAIKDAFEARVPFTGVTVHFIDEEVDHGPIILQESVEIKKSDTLESLEAKIHKVEHKIYPKVIRLFCEGRLKFRRGKVIIRKPYF